MIQFLHVWKTYPPNHRALADINFEVADGELVFVVGASGAGKSTLLKLLFREEEPSAGQILLHGKNITRLNRHGVARLRRSIGLVFQECKLLARLTALENVALAAEVVGVSKRESRIRAYQLLRELGLKDRHDATPFALSAGERQRVAIARAVINNPLLVLADEPTGNLDVDVADETMRLLLRTGERGATIIIATHDFGIVDRYASRVVSLHRGVLKENPGWQPARGRSR
jgi:cell division transport system ATP-binding protein